MKPILEKQIPGELKSIQGDSPIIFGLRYLEEEASEIRDIVGCQTINPTGGGGGGSFTNLNLITGCDDGTDSD
jgi:hypothetical protein